MGRIQISGDDDHLSLTLTPGAQRVVPGCMMLGFTFFCLTLLAVLAIVKADIGGGEETNFVNPRANHFGFLWLTTTLAAAIVTPIYAVRVILAPIVFRFDRETGFFTQCGKKVAPLTKIESVKIAHADDPDNRTLHRLVVVHSDGFETTVDNWYDEEESNFVAKVVADFCCVKVIGLRADSFEDGGMVPRSEGL